MPPKKRGKSAKGGRSGGGEAREAALAHKAAGNAAFSAGDYTTAIAEFSAAIKADGSDAVFWGNRSACHAALGDFKAAVADGQKCVELRPEWSKGYGRLGLALFRLGDLAGAQRAYAQGLSIDPDSDALADALSEVRRAAKAQAMNNDRDEALSGAMDGMDAGSAPDPPDVAPVQVGHVIGIDLGTTYSCVAVWRNGEPEVIANEEGERTTPSWVAFTAEGERLVGDSAKRQAAMNPTRTLFNIKRIIGRQFSECSEDIKRMPFPVTEGKGGRPSIEVDVAGTKRMYMPEQISAMVLEKMKATAEMALGEKVSKAVVTVPAYFNDSQRRLTKDAGAIAGLDVLRIINEPTAAALAYGLDKAAESEEEQNVLVFDLGGGTFDVSLLRIESGVFEVLATAGDTHLGGEDFDSAVADWVAGEVKRKHKQDYFTGDARNTRKLRAASERAKRQLSSSQTAQVELSVGDEEICVELSRAKFEKLNETTFQRCMDAVQRVMKDANLKKTDVGEIVLVGGSTRVPRVQKILQDYFDGKQLCKSVNPDEAVAYGAAVQGAILAGVRDPSMQSLLLVDVIPLSLGVECEGKQFAKVVPRNTSVPCKKSSEFTTVEDWQTEIDIRIFEGERQNTDGNHLLGEFNITGVERARRGEAKVDVTFEVNTNGLLTVSARDKVTGARANVEIQHDRGRLSSEEVERMMAEAERYREEDERRAREYEERRARELEDDDY